MNNTQAMIIEECDKIKEMLLKKNNEYGDAIINPLRIFSSVDIFEQINVRIDDKLSRIMNKNNKEIKEDTLLDLIGYLIFKLISRRLKLNG